MKPSFRALALCLSSVLAIYPLHLHAADSFEDPYAKIEHIKLDNGLQVFLARSDDATMTEVRVEVAAGVETEDKSNWGVSHLLEHVLFRDKGLKEEMTYLQLIKEAGGSANGTTQERETNYFGTVPSVKSAWLLGTISKMILEPVIDDEYVTKEKGTVELERGTPGPITLSLGFNPADYLRPRYLEQPNFWQTEFGIPAIRSYTLSEEQLANRRLSSETLKKYYNEYYYPANMRLFVAGKFDRAEVMKIIETKWATLPSRTGKTVLPDPKPVPRVAPYIASTVHEGTPHLYLGTKVWDVSVLEYNVIAAYMEYLAHRLMKDIRNLKGQTYSANSSTQISKGYGYSFIEFQTTQENLTENYELAKSYLKNEARAGGLTEAQVKDAIKMYLDGYKLHGREAQQMMHLAINVADIIRDFGAFTSPYAALVNVSPEQFNAILKENFKAEQAYEYINRPSLLFQYDSTLLIAVVALTSFFLSRRWLTKPFENDKVAWIRNIKYPPLKSLELSLAVIGLYIMMHVTFVTDLVFKTTPFLQSSIVTSHYLHGVIYVVSVIAVAQFLLSLLPKKLMVVKDELVIKSISYYSQRIPLQEIASVEAVSVLSPRFLLSKKFFSIGMRYFYFNQLFWQKGLLLQLKDGRSYYFSVSSGDKASAELNGLISRNHSSNTETKVAA